MDSPTPRSVAADANILLSAAIGGAAQRVFHETDMEVVTTEEVLATCGFISWSWGWRTA